jgi:DNA modification methylase
MQLNKIYNENCLKTLQRMEDNFIDCVVTSPPYWGLRNYGHEDQIGLEKTPEEYVARMVEIFREVRRVLKKEGTLWLNLGDSYYNGDKGGERDEKRIKYSSLQQNNSGSLKINQPNRNPIPGFKPKDLIGIPWRVAFALQADGWWLRQDIIRSKPNPMPESVRDRCTKSHEYIFLLTKSAKYFYDAEAIVEKRSVWEITTQPIPEAHFAVFPESEIFL